ncbi:MAG: flagellar motor switch protein FliG [Pseudomonadota bacterium]|nr:flagellar motor switch protein FliG [Pseudomonadota bacterium]
MADKENTLSGTESAAVLLLSLGEEHAASILRNMEPREVQKVSAAMSSLSSGAGKQVGTVLGNFVTDVSGQPSLGVGSDRFVSNVLEQAFGAEKAGNLLNHVLDGNSTKGLETLKWMDPLAVADVIRKEHPQIIAIVLSQLDSDQASAVLKELPEESRVDILMRVARMDTIHPSALKELDEILAKQFSSSGDGKPSIAGGTKTVADLLNHLGKEEETAISRGISELDEALAQEISELMFVFENLKDVNDRGIQALLREVSSDSLVVALKGADEEINEKIFSNMSKRAAEMLRDDLETKGPVKLSEVQEAQKEILVVAQRMAESGDLVLGGKGGDEYV